MKNNPTVYLNDILESIVVIEEHILGMDFSQFADDIKTQDSVIRRLAIIGEAVNNLPEEEKQKASTIPWGKIVGMRNFLVHEYANIETERIWQTLLKDLPNLKMEVERILLSSN